MTRLTRRQFLKAGTIAAAGLSLYACSKTGRVSLGNDSIANTNTENVFRANIWLQIGIDNIVTISIAETDMGQGVMTSLAMLIAEELDADWSRIRAVRAPLHPQYGHQATGGSSSVKDAWLVLRRAGATARTMLLNAATSRWGVTLDECTVANSTVLHPHSKQHANFGELAREAARQPVPKDVKLKAISEFHLLGSDPPRIDTEEKTKGKIQFGIDFQLKNKLVAVVTQNPWHTGRALNFNDDAAKKIATYHSTLVFDDFVAIIARDTWGAIRAQREISIAWPNQKDTSLDSNTIYQRLKSGLSTPAFIVYTQGDINIPNDSITAQYFIPYQAHATPETPNAIAHFDERGGEIWSGMQSPTRAHDLLVENRLGTYTRITEKLLQKLGGSISAVQLHPLPLGGGFGRRLENDYILQAAEIGTVVGSPVQVLWTREEDIQHDFYRPASLHSITGSLNTEGRVSHWQHKIVGPSIDESSEPGSTAKQGYDNKSVEGAKNIPYAIPNIQVSTVLEQVPVRCGLWRSVGHSANAFVVESFIDELAHASKQDPLKFRLASLTSKPRHTRTLKAVADAAGWDRPPPRGRARGMAVHESFGSVVAQIVEVSVHAGKIQVHRVFCAIDCGIAVHPDGIRAQMEGSIVFGLTATLKGEITVANGRVVQSNFHDYPILRLSEMPEIITVIVASNEPPSGAGEPAVPVVAPAVANALFAATGVRVRKLPILIDDFIKSKSI